MGWLGALTFGCCGKMRTHSVLHYGPLIAIILISTITLNTVTCLQHMKFDDDTNKLLMIRMFLTIVAGICVCFFYAVFAGGGAFPKGWRPANKDDEKFLQFCKICDGFKPPRSHHCHDCGACVPKLDHHCPWINSCVGNRNHVPFLGFVSLVPLGCMMAAVIQASFLWHEVPEAKFIPYLRKYNPSSFNFLVMTVMSFASSLGVSLAVGALGLFQCCGIIYNTTQIESWIVEKAEKRRRGEGTFVFPYDLGFFYNVAEFFVRWYKGDGANWTVVEGCDQYTFTKEQLAQKAAKRARTKLFKIDANFNGRSFIAGCEYGCSRWWEGPGFMEPLVKLQIGEVMKVWSASDEWFYGEKVQIVDGKYKEVKPRQRGWFPGEIIGDEVENSKKKTKAVDVDEDEDMGLDDVIPSCGPTSSSNKKTK
eukprot:m.155989 g.155989  ORF g.155989 m.155989 type:complete len:421 (+) comp30965_c0_seq2:260-1522(+)